MIPVTIENSSNLMLLLILAEARGIRFAPLHLIFIGGLVIFSLDGEVLRLLTANIPLIILINRLLLLDLGLAWRTWLLWGLCLLNLGWRWAACSAWGGSNSISPAQLLLDLIVSGTSGGGVFQTGGSGDGVPVNLKRVS